MVLDTSGAAWNLQLDKSDGRPLKKARILEGDDDVRETKATKEKEKRTERAKTRTGLWGFAMPGSQTVPDKGRDSTPCSEDDDMCVESGGLQSDGEPLVDVMDAKDDDGDRVEEIDELASDVDGTTEDTPMDLDDLQQQPQSPDVTPPDHTNEAEIIDLSTCDDLQDEESSVEEPPRKTWGNDGTSWQINLEELTKTWMEYAQRAAAESSEKSHIIQPLQDVTYVDDEAGLQNTDEETAIKALSRVIEKDDFNTMGVVGQFNKGFIITRRLRQPSSTEDQEIDALDDLFIVDQHAADEKYNFEDLQQTIKLQAQKLVRCVFF